MLVRAALQTMIIVLLLIVSVTQSSFFHSGEVLISFKYKYM